MDTIFDSHCHPQFAAYDADREDVINRAISENVRMIAVGTSRETSVTGIELAKKYPGKIFSTVGIHPHHATETPHDPQETKIPITDIRFPKSEFSALVKLPEVVAIGECGLDYHYLKPVPGDNSIYHTQAAQRTLLEQHIELAREIKKPLVIHARDAYRDILDILTQTIFPHGIVIHFFQGTPSEALQLLDIGAYISFAGPITFTDQYDDTIRAVPLERILIETDAPYASPEPYRGKRNEPIYVRHVAAKISTIKNLPLSTVIKATANNACELFRIREVL